MGAKARDLAMFNLAIDSKLRACDLTRLRVRDVCLGSRVAPPSEGHAAKRPSGQCSSRSPSRRGIAWKPGSRQRRSLRPTFCFRGESMRRAELTQASAGRLDQRDSMRRSPQPAHDPVKAAAFLRSCPWRFYSAMSPLTMQTHKADFAQNELFGAN